MNILLKLKETAVSVLPVMLIVLVFGLFVVPMDGFLLGRFIIGGLFLIFGLTIFLLGVDMGIQPMGERSGAELTKRKNLWLLLGCAFLIGFIVTAAEPDIQVFGAQVKQVFSSVNKTVFTFVIATGVGLFVMMGLLRSIINFSLKWTLLIFYTILFTFALLAKDSFIGIGFDAGGATTGPMTVPFIMALGLGVSTVRASKNDNSFGLTGIASVGPVMAVIVYSFFISDKGGQTLVEATAQTAAVTQGFYNKLMGPFHGVFPHVLKDSLLSIAPLFAMFIIFQITLLKMTKRQEIRMVIGFIYSFVGLSIFLTGVNGGFMQAGKILGELLGSRVIAGGSVWFTVLMITGLALGAIIVCAEPAVWVLSEQVESVSGGTIKRKMLLVFLSVGTAIAIGLSLWRCVKGFDIKWILIPGYLIAMVLMPFCPDLFTGIAFDSGGVASGPLTSTFILSFTIGAANACGGGNNSFGVIALVALMPLIAIQIMGIVYKIKTEKKVNAGGTNV